MQCPDPKRLISSVCSKAHNLGRVIILGFDFCVFHTMNGFLTDRWKRECLGLLASVLKDYCAPLEGLGMHDFHDIVLLRKSSSCIRQRYKRRPSWKIKPQQRTKLSSTQPKPLKQCSPSYSPSLSLQLPLPASPPRRAAPVLRSAASRRVLRVTPASQTSSVLSALSCRMSMLLLVLAAVPYL